MGHPPYRTGSSFASARASVQGIDAWCGKGLSIGAFQSIFAANSLDEFQVEQREMVFVRNGFSTTASLPSSGQSHSRHSSRVGPFEVKCLVFASHKDMGFCRRAFRSERFPIPSPARVEYHICPRHVPSLSELPPCWGPKVIEAARRSRGLKTASKLCSWPPGPSTSSMCAKPGKLSTTRPPNLASGRALPSSSKYKFSPRR